MRIIRIIVEILTCAYLNKRIIIVDENRENQAKEEIARQELLENMEEHKRLEIEQKLERKRVMLLLMS